MVELRGQDDQNVSFSPAQPRHAQTGLLLGKAPQPITITKNV